MTNYAINIRLDDYERPTTYFVKTIIVPEATNKYFHLAFLNVIAPNNVDSFYKVDRWGFRISKPPFKGFADSGKGYPPKMAWKEIPDKINKYTQRIYECGSIYFLDVIKTTEEVDDLNIIDYKNLTDEVPYNRQVQRDILMGTTNSINPYWRIVIQDLHENKEKVI